MGTFCSMKVTLTHHAEESRAFSWGLESFFERLSTDSTIGVGTDEGIGEYTVPKNAKAKEMKKKLIGLSAAKEFRAPRGIDSHVAR